MNIKINYRELPMLSWLIGLYSFTNKELFDANLNSLKNEFGDINKNAYLQNIY